MTDKPTGVFVRLPLSEDQKQAMYDYVSGDVSMEEAFLAIGTPVTGGTVSVVDYSEYEPKYHDQGMGCGLEDRGIHDRYEAMGYGWDQAIERVCSDFPETVLLSDHLAALASLQAEAKRLEDEAEQIRRKNFNAGYLLACCNIVNMHNEEGIPADILCELGITEEEVNALDLTEYDAKALEEIRNARGTDPIVKGPEA